MTFQHLVNSFLLLFLFSSSIAFSQSGTDSPYPINNRPTSNKTDDFIALFEDTDVGNLHIYSTKEKMPKDSYFYRGTEMDTYYKTMLPRKWRKKIRGKDAKAYAVKNIAGADREYYIIRFLDKKERNHLALFELNQENLVHKMDLAYAWCKRNRCVQKDTWIQDVDGDTLLDLIIKTRRERNSLQKDDIEIYKQTRTGQFIKDMNMKVDSIKYSLEKL